MLSYDSSQALDSRILGAEEENCKVRFSLVILMILAHSMNAMLAASLHGKNLHISKISDSDRDLDSSKITYYSVSLSFMNLAPSHNPPSLAFWMQFLPMSLKIVLYMLCTCKNFALDQLPHTHPYVRARFCSSTTYLKSHQPNFGKRWHGTKLKISAKWLLCFNEYAVQEYGNARDLVVCGKYRHVTTRNQSITTLGIHDFSSDYQKLR